jgi:hypothetical protein
MRCSRRYYLHAAWGFSTKLAAPIGCVSPEMSHHDRSRRIGVVVVPALSPAGRSPTPPATVLIAQEASDDERKGSQT